MTDQEIAYRFVKNFQKTNPKKSPLILLNEFYFLGSIECFDWSHTPEGMNFWVVFYSTRMKHNEDKIRKFLRVNYFDVISKKNFINLRFIL